MEHATPERPVIYYAVDAYANREWRAAMPGWRPDEAVTEYLTREIARRIGAPQANSLYTPCLPAVERLAAVIGESALCEAFFQGDFWASQPRAWTVRLGGVGDTSPDAV